jgi:hypothetical protein
MAQKVKELAVVTGTYTDAQGQQKNRYMNVGGVFKTQDGGTFILLNRAINFAGLPFKDGSDSVMVGVYDLRDANAQGNAQRATTTQQRSAPPPPPVQIPDDDIPF